MKTLLITLSGMMAFMGGGSCDPIGPHIPHCDWSDTNHVVFYNMEFHHPGSLSNYHEILVNYPERDFNNILSVKGDANNTVNRASITVDIKADGSQCRGEQTRKYGSESTKVQGSQIEIPYPLGYIFAGEVTVNAKTDIFINMGSGGSYYHVKWTSTGNNPNGGMQETVYGVKMSHFGIDGSNIYVPPVGLYLGGELSEQML